MQKPINFIIENKRKISTKIPGSVWKI